MHSSREKKIIISGAIFATAIFAFFSYRQYSSSILDLAANTLFRGRIILGTEIFNYDSRDPNRTGNLKNIQDGDLDSAVILAYPSRHPEGAHLLIDTALSHWPPDNKSSSPRTRVPRKIIVYNGPCTNCERSEFRSYSRIKRARIEFLVRQANDPDQEFLHEKTLPLLILEKNFEDRPGPQTIEFNSLTFKESSGYPDQVFYIVLKVSILDVYPGSEFPNRAALSELTYMDASGESGPKAKTGLHIWK